ncbi:MAG: dTDP-4-dehydrorhamnose reductase [bacterium]
MISSNDLIKNRILIIGSNGMLGQRLTGYFSSFDKVELFCSSAETSSFIPDVSYLQVDISQKNEVKKLIHNFYPDFIINAAAYTNVDGCEIEKELAWKINVDGVVNISKSAKAIHAHVIHMSTDYVFDGFNGPYSEIDTVNPISYYGRTKLAAENVLREGDNTFAIIRTNVLYGPAKYGRPDFVKWAVNSLRENKNIRIVTDQINNPTYIDDIVDAISKIIEFRKTGIYNIGGAEFLSRFDFTLRIADFFSLDKNLILPILTEDLKQPARRPLKSGLITLKAQTEFGFRPRSIMETFSLMKAELNL